MLSKRIAAAAHISLLGLFHRGGNSFLRWVLQFPGLAQQVLRGQGSVTPSWQPAHPPGWAMPQAESDMDLGSAAAKPGMREPGCVLASQHICTSQTPSAPTQLPEH